MELLFDHVTLQIYLLHTIGHFQVIEAHSVSVSVMSEDLRLRGVVRIHQWLLFLLQVCPAVRQARPSRPCDRPRWRRCVLHSQFRGEIRPVTPCVLPGNVQPGEWKDKICRGLVQIQKAPWVCLGFFSSLYFNMCFSFVSIELWRHWTMPSGSSATYWCTFTVMITKTRMSFAGIVTLTCSTTSWQVVKWVSECVVCYVIALFYSALWNTH